MTNGVRGLKLLTSPFYLRSYLGHSEGDCRISSHTTCFLLGPGRQRAVFFHDRTLGTLLQIGCEECILTILSSRCC